MYKSKIRCIVTGGTIDDIEYSSLEAAPEKHNSLIPGLLRQARVTTEYTLDEVMQKDSKFITDEDRQLIAQKIIDAPEDKIIITHGTMTIVQTAQYLGALKISKTVVLLGALVPANKEGSDALFNVGAAFSSVQLLPVGVYITMNGKIFAWDKVQKNIGKGIFESTE